MNIMMLVPQVIKWMIIWTNTWRQTKGRYNICYSGDWNFKTMPSDIWPRYTLKLNLPINIQPTKPNQKEIPHLHRLEMWQEEGNGQNLKTPCMSTTIYTNGPYFNHMKTRRLHEPAIYKIFGHPEQQLCIKVQHTNISRILPNTDIRTQALWSWKEKRGISRWTP